MNTPTPRTDSAWAKTFEDDKDQCRAGNAASDMRDECATLERELAALAAERDHLHAQLRALTLICGTSDANKFSTWIDRANARAERAEAAETVALAKWNGALERAMKAEADLAALEQCHDDNCRAVVKLDAELATERARLDSGQIMLTVAGERVWHCGVDLRAAIDLAMKEDAK
tara:strand:- start:18 stop:539 length:522 start_codon:yes stop_codon:yes gene_type:complete